MTSFTLVSCSKSKQDGIHLARNLYQPSRNFRKRVEYAKEHSDDWGILSAEYGFLHPTEPIPDYERKISSRNDTWGAIVLQKLLPVLESRDVDGVTILAGAQYIDPIQTELEARGYEVHDPHAGLRPGERYSALCDALSPGEQKSLSEDF
ncbi:DUF6884 domain-containing protein [Haloarcula sp. Atlit-7R]|uniref:DUF6884 domain-containing protein n=1 Tax=Haloarcula sp. Atlit-7R TaxID=2282125 RepID=UPI000EF155D9|nr:hypothetical protein D3D01_15560 [Haloarcula sp. Atlit-7R]